MKVNHKIYSSLEAIEPALREKAQISSGWGSRFYIIKGTQGYYALSFNPFQRLTNAFLKIFGFNYFAYVLGEKGIQVLDRAALTPPARKADDIFSPIVTPAPPLQAPVQAPTKPVDPLRQLLATALNSLKAEDHLKFKLTEFSQAEQAWFVQAVPDLSPQELQLLVEACLIYPIAGAPEILFSKLCEGIKRLPNGHPNVEAFMDAFLKYQVFLISFPLTNWESMIKEIGGSPLKLFQIEDFYRARKPDLIAKDKATRDWLYTNSLYTAISQNSFNFVTSKAFVELFDQLPKSNRELLLQRLCEFTARFVLHNEDMKAKLAKVLSSFPHHRRPILDGFKHFDEGRFLGHLSLQEGVDSALIGSMLAVSHQQGENQIFYSRFFDEMKHENGELFKKNFGHLLDALFENRSPYQFVSMKLFWDCLCSGSIWDETNYAEALKLLAERIHKWPTSCSQSDIREFFSCKEWILYKIASQIKAPHEEEKLRTILRIRDSLNIELDAGNFSNPDNLKVQGIWRLLECHDESFEGALIAWLIEHLEPKGSDKERQETQALFAKLVEKLKRASIESWKRAGAQVKLTCFHKGPTKVDPQLAAWLVQHQKPKAIAAFLEGLASQSPTDEGRKQGKKQIFESFKRAINH